MCGDSRTSSMVFTGVLAACMSFPAAAQDAWPRRTITYVVPFPPGGSTDLLARLVAQKLGPALGASVIIDNKPGAAGIIGSEFVAKAAPDGYVILAGNVATHGTHPSLYAKLPYDAIKSFEPVSLIGTIPCVLAVGAASPYKTVQEVIAAAKAKPGSLSFGSGGNGTSLHLAGELFKSLAGIDMVHVPYKGDVPALTDVMAGHISMTFSVTTTSTTHIQSGKVRALAVTSPTRINSLPNVPTMIESGVPGYEVDTWQAVHAPAGTPRPIVQRLSSEIARIVKEPDVVERFEQLGAIPVGSTPEQLAAFQKADMAKWAKLAKSIGLKLD